MRVRALVAVALLAVALAGCGDDSGSTAGSTPTPAPSSSVGSGTTLGPTEGEVACSDLAQRYVRRARALFTTEGTPSDELVDRSREHFIRLDTIAAAAACGPEYTTEVCDGLDDLTHEGVLVILPLTTAQCL